jgi:hypothetical protein
MVGVRVQFEFNLLVTTDKRNGLETTKYDFRKAIESTDLLATILYFPTSLNLQRLLNSYSISTLWPDSILMNLNDPVGELSMAGDTFFPDGETTSNEKNGS